MEGMWPVGAEIRLFPHALTTSISSPFHHVGIIPEIVPEEVCGLHIPLQFSR
jgi:hypothetical protein